MNIELAERVGVSHLAVSYPQVKSSPSYHVIQIIHTHQEGLLFKMEKVNNIENRTVTTCKLALAVFLVDCNG